MSNSRQSNSGAKPCNAADCKEEACFFITWAEDRRCVKFSELCDEHARIALTSAGPPEPVPRPFQSRSTNDAFEVDLEYVVVTTRYPEQCVYLRDPNDRCHVPFLTGYYEALALSRLLKGEPVVVPQTHDAMGLLVRTLGGSVEKVCITSLEAGFYRAQVTLIQAGNRHFVDMRPSDAIILALMFQCPIMFNKDLWKQALSLDTQ